MDIPLHHIAPNPQQPRTHFDPAQLEELTASIREHGVILPVALEAIEDWSGEESDPRYYLEDGERRWRAAKMAGLTMIPALVNPSRNGTGPRLRLERALVANLQRADMNPVEAGRAYLQLRDVHGLTIRQIARALGKRGAGGEAHVSHRLFIAEKMDAPIQALIAAGKLHLNRDLLEALLTIPDASTRIAFAEKMAEKQFSVKGCLTLIEKYHTHLNTPLTQDQPPALQLAARHGAPPQWDAFRQHGHVPPWSHIESSVRATCKACPLAENASPTICQACPVVILLIQLRAVEKSAPAVPVPLSKHPLSGRPAYTRKGK